MEDDREICNTRLGLGIGSDEYTPNTDRPKKKQVVCLNLSIPLHPKQEIVEEGEAKIDGDEGELSGDSSKSKCSPNNKESDENDGGNSNNGSRKKLRLTKEQSTLLEESFKIHNTLNPTEKQTLADKLNLRPRQVEVWFQNRRARTKLKQTEVDCEFLKKCCDSLSDENSRLKRELQELRMLKLDHHSFRHHRPLPHPPPPLYIQMPKAATLTMCPSCCEKSFKTSGGSATIMALGSNLPPPQLPPPPPATAAVTDLVHIPNSRKRSSSEDSS